MSHDGLGPDVAASSGAGQHTGRDVAASSGAGQHTDRDVAGVHADVATPRRFSGVVVILVAAVALAVGALTGVLALSSARTPVTAGEGTVEAGFARDMQAHHAQAVELAVLIRDRSEDQQVRTVALDILLTQQNQIGQMASWLRTWDLPAAAAAPPMAWMGAGHADHGGGATPAGYEAMPGWVAPENLARLREATGAEADRIFLDLMIDHHRGGVEMARYAAEHARVPQVVELAEGIVATQEREMATLQEMLAAR